MPKLRLDIPAKEYAVLEMLAEREYRTADMQATWMLVQSLREYVEKQRYAVATLPTISLPLARTGLITWEALCARYPTEALSLPHIVLNTAEGYVELFVATSITQEAVDHLCQALRIEYPGTPVAYWVVDGAPCGDIYHEASQPCP